MKASEIISDDIVSREKYKTKDVVGKKTASQDYFGNRADKRDDRALVSKDKKERKKEWFEEDKQSIDESFRFTEFFPLLEMSERLDLLEEYFTKNKNLLESNDKTRAKQFINLRRYGVKPVSKQKYVVTLVSLINDKFRMIESPEVVTFVDQQNNEYIVKDSNNNLKKFPTDYVKEVVIAITLFFDRTESYNKFRTTVGLTFNAGMPDIDVDSLVNKSVEEGSMQSATHKPEGAKFGGYWKSTDKAPPKPGQGVGGAA